MQYPNLDKEQIIKEIKKIKKDEYPHIWLEDISEWYPYPGAEPFPESWVVGDKVVVSQSGMTMKGEDKKTYKITNKIKEQDAGGFLLNNPDKPDEIIKNLEGHSYEMRKSLREKRRSLGRKSTINSREAYRDVQGIILKEGEPYPEEYLDTDWCIEEVIWDHVVEDDPRNPSSFYPDPDEYDKHDSVVISDPANSLWLVTETHVSKISFRHWEEGQRVRVLKPDQDRKIPTLRYNMQNLDIPNSTVGVYLLGSAQSKF